jgi:hypothetical protein
MGRNELSEVDLDGGSIREEIQRSSDRIDAMLQQMAEASRQRAIRTEEFIANSDVVRAESLAFHRELRERIDRLPPAKRSEPR